MAYGDTFSAAQTAADREAALRQQRELQYAQMDQQALESMGRGMGVASGRALQVLGIMQGAGNSPAIERSALMDAKAGRYASSAYPGLHPQIDRSLNAINSDAVANLERDFHVSTAHANVLNRRNELTSNIAEIDKFIKENGGIGHALSKLINGAENDPLSIAVESKKQYKTELDALPSPHPEDQTYKEIHATVYQDPKTGVWMSALNPPPTMHPDKRQMQISHRNVSQSQNLNPSGNSGTSSAPTPDVIAPNGWTPTTGGVWERPARGDEAMSQADRVTYQMTHPADRRGMQSGTNIADTVSRMMQPPIDVQANVQPADYEAAAYGPTSAGLVRLPRAQVAKMYGESRFGRLPDVASRGLVQDPAMAPMIDNTQQASMPTTTVTAQAPNIMSVQSPKAAGTNATVRMLSADGRVYDVLGVNVPIALRRGAKIIQ